MNKKNSRVGTSIKFVIAITDDNELEFKFLEYTPEEFLQYSTIPPFKVFFNINLNDKNNIQNRRTSIQASKEVLEKFISFFENSKM